MIDVPLWLCLTALAAAFGLVPALWLSSAIAVRARRWWRWSWTATLLRSHLRSVRTIARTTAGVRRPDRAPAVPDRRHRG